MARSTGLGKGLGALIPAAATSPSDGLQDLPVARIRPNPHQPRRTFDEETLNSLSASIAELGVLQPILVRRRPDYFELIAGERRWRAAQRAGLITIPAIVQDRDELSSLQAAIVENLHRQDLNPIEEAAAYQQLIDDFGLTHDLVAKKIGKSRATVSNTLRLLQLPSKVQRLLIENRLTTGHAKAILGSPDRSFQEHLASAVAEDQLSVRKTEECVRDGILPGQKRREQPAHTEPPAKSPQPAAVLEIEHLLQDTLETKAEIDMRKSGGGHLKIHFSDLSDLHRIASLIIDPQFQH